MKTHRFIVTVKTSRTKAAAKSAVLCAFGKRQPDGCEFRVAEFRKPKPEVRVEYVDPNYIA
jgi:hypothetical protein